MDATREGGVRAPGPRRGVFLATLLLGGLLVLAHGCRDSLVTELDTNLAPDTYLTGVPAESTTTFYRVHLWWYGNDEDGRVVGYEYAISDSLPGDVDTLTYHYTTRTDSVFLFPVGASQQVLGHRFYVRAIDDHGATDPEPAWTFFGAIDLIPPTAIFTVAEAFNTDLDSAWTLTSTAEAVPTDTVDAGWNVRFQWGGVDRDRMIDEHGDTVYVGAITQYEHWMVPLEAAPTVGGLADTSITYTSLSSGKYRFALRARDDAGFQGLDPSVRSFVWNRDPQTFIRRDLNPATGESLAVLTATSTAWAGERTYFSGDTIPLKAGAGGAVIPVVIEADVSGTDPDDIKGTGVRRFQYRLGASAWRPIQDTLNNVVRLTGVRTANAFLNVRCADGFGRPDGTPAMVAIYVNRAPRLLEIVGEDGGVPIYQFPRRGEVVALDSIRAWGDSLRVRVRAWDPDSTTSSFWYSFRVSGALFESKNIESTTSYYETRVRVANPQVGPMVLEVRIQEDARQDALIRDAVRAIPFEVR
jgi:hypothetical protein